jgi:hypothetical protein
MPVGSCLIPLTAIAAIAFTKGPSVEAMVSERKLPTRASASARGPFRPVIRFQRQGVSNEE